MNVTLNDTWAARLAKHVAVQVSEGSPADLSQECLSQVHLTQALSPLRRGGTEFLRFFPPAPSAHLSWPLRAAPGGAVSVSQWLI